MNKLKVFSMLIALLLCVSMVFSVVVLAAGEDNQSAATGESTGATTGESTGETPSQGTEPSETPEGTEPGETPEGTQPGEGTEPGEDTGETPGETPDPEPEEPGDGKMHISNEMIEVLKQLEGFSPHAYWDYSQYSIGYGSECPKGKEKYYMSKEDGGEGHEITVEYAEELLRKELDYFEEVVNNFITRHSLTLAQHQYDALISFTYNTGYAWTSTTGNLVTAVISGDTGSHFIYGMMLWSMAGQRHILVKRRSIETNIYANGVYPTDVFADDVVPDRYRIAFMDGNGGVVNYDEHGFDALQPISIKTKFKSAPTGPDETGATVTYVFDGWYTQRVGGTKVEVLDESIPTGAVLYAHWKTPAGTPVIIPSQNTLKLSVTVTGNNVNVRSGPDTYYASLYKAQQGDVLQIEEVISRGSLTWGRFGDQWIALKYTDYNTAKEQQFPKWGMVSSSTLNVRTGAGTDYALVEGVQKVRGDLLLVTNWKSDGTMMWGKIEEGWIALPYVTFDGVLPPDQTVQSIQVTQKPNKLAYVHKVDALDITGGKLLVTYMDGSTTTVEITMDMVSGFDNTNEGVNTITVTYGGKTTTFEVLIVRAKVIFQMADGTIIAEKEYLFGDTVEAPVDPTKPADETYTYVFAGWDKEIVPCDGNAVYTASFTPVYIDYTVIFRDEDGAVISEQTYHWGDEITIPADPTKSADNTCTYAFAGWDKEVAAVCGGNAEYTAVYNAAYIEYTVTFQYEDGTVIGQYTLHYGDAVTAPAAPTAPKGYQFVGWDQPITVCQGDVTYTAVFALKDRIPGDLDDNDEVNTDDVFKLLLHISLPEMFPVDADVDFNGDGVVTTDDVFRLLLHISLPDMFPL